MYRAIVILIATEAILVDANPSCKESGTSDIICTAGAEDYVLSRGLVSDNNRTTGITLRDCKIIEVGYESFENLPALEYLDLSKNKIKILQLGVLDEFIQLKLLNLSYNQLSGFPLGLFDQKPNLEVLDLKGNKIIQLELGIFDLMKKLKHVDISSNKIQGRNINVYIFDQSTKIEFMDFSRNDMFGSDDMLLNAFKAIRFLNLDRCSLTEVPTFATAGNLKTMRHLMLSSNRISSLEDENMFKNLEMLEILNLTGNIIETIAENVFNKLKKLRVIMIARNRLKYISETMFRNMLYLTTVDLSHNKIEYIPVNAFRNSPIKNLNLSDNRFTYLIDNFCLELKNSGGKLAKFYFNQNPWQCACLRDILEEVKTQGISYNAVKYNGKEVVCVSTNEFNCKRQMEANEHYKDLYYNTL